MLTYQPDPDGFLYGEGDGDHTISVFEELRIDDIASQPTQLEELVPSSPLEAYLPVNTTNGPRTMDEEQNESPYGNTLKNDYDQQDYLQRNGEHTIDTGHIPAISASRIHNTAEFTSPEAQSPSCPNQTCRLTNTSNGQWKMDETEYDTGILESPQAIDDAKNPGPESKTQSTVVLLGKLGHGKTRMVNMLCGETFDSNMGNSSCTRSMQVGESLLFGISIIDTPGFYSCRDTSEHISQQKSALEGEPLNGIYAVVKFGRIDEMVEILGQIMDFCGDDDIRILITHMDVAASEPDFDFKETRELLSESLDVSVDNIGFVGKGDSGLSNHEVLTTSEDLENFVWNTLHEPRSFEVSIEQSAYMSSRSPGARQFESQLSQIYARIQTALEVCEKVSRLSDPNARDYYLDQVKTAAIAAVQDCIQTVVIDGRTSIQRQSSGLAASELNVVHANVNVKLKLGVDRFISKSDSLVPARYVSSYSYSGVHSGRRQRLRSQFSERLTAQFGFDCTQSITWVLKRRDGKKQTILLADLPQLALELQPEQPSRRARKKRDKKKSRNSYHSNRPSVAKSASSTSTNGNHGFGMQIQSQLQLQHTPGKEKTLRTIHGVEAGGGGCQDAKETRALVVSERDEKRSILADDAISGSLGKSHIVPTGTFAQPTFGKDPPAHKMHERSKCDEANNARSASGSGPLQPAAHKDGDSVSHSWPLVENDDADRAGRAATWIPHTINKRQNCNEAVDQQHAEEPISSTISRGDGSPYKHTMEQDDSFGGAKRRRTATSNDQPLSWFSWFCAALSY